ncbi:MAG: AraC-like transcriptional regulator QhpR [Woeseiaceae bacterium]
MTNTYVSSMALSGWRRTLQSMDRGADGVCAPMLAKIDKMIADNPEKVRLDDYVRLLEEIGRSCKSSSLAWAAGHAVDLPFDKMFSTAIRGCKSLGTSLQWLCQYFALLQDASILRLDVAEDWTTLSYKILDPEIWPRHEDAMYTLGIFSRLIKAAAPESWSQVQISVESEPDQVKVDLGSIVQTNVIFGASANSIRMPTAIINAPVTTAKPCDPDVLKKLATELTKKRRLMPVSERTRRVIYREMNDGCVNQEYIARELGISSRTLRRRLSLENQSFQQLLDECRMQFAALEFRTRSRMSLSDMALKLGYSEHSTFSRAFARWAGMAPQEYRRTVAMH